MRASDLTEGGSQVGLAELRDALARCLDVLRCNGVVPSPGSRYLEGLSLLERIERSPSSAVPEEWMLLSELACDLRELLVIISRPPILSAQLNCIERILKGNLEPWADCPTSPRDLQLELYTAGILELGGLSVSFEEPDLRVRCQGQDYGIAVKRIGSMARLDERIRIAVSQIRRSGVPGFVALGISSMVRDRDKYIGVPGIRGLDAALRALATDSLRCVEEAAKARHKSCVWGYIVQFGIPALLQGPSVAGLWSCQFIPAVLEDDARYPATKDLLNRTCAGFAKACESWPSPPGSASTHGTDGAET